MTTEMSLQLESRANTHNYKQTNLLKQSLNNDLTKVVTQSALEVLVSEKLSTARKES